MGTPLGDFVRAERAGVGRQTVYRWWSTKAEVLFEASVADAEEELAVSPAETPLAEITSYLQALVRFLAHSPAGVMSGRDPERLGIEELAHSFLQSLRSEHR
jgi:AcrR family transcriptional regulator